MNELISEFFIDIITRVIPGFIILALYPDKLFTSVFLKFHDFPILLIPGLIGAAWVIGFAIEQASYLPFAFVVRWLPKECPIRKNLIGGRQFSATENETSKFWRRHLLKQAGEKILFRVLCAISLFTWKYPPTLSLFKNAKWFIWHHIPVYSLLGTLIFGLAWFWVQINPQEPKNLDQA